LFLDRQPQQLLTEAEYQAQIHSLAGGKEEQQLPP
jgi:hypothetical protein